MITINHHTNTDLTPDEKRHLRERQQAQGAFVGEALAALNALTGPNVSSYAVHRAVATLQHEPHADVAHRYLEARRSPSGRGTSQRASTRGSPQSSELHRITDGAGSSTAGRISPMRGSMHNAEFDRRLALREETDDFFIPLDRPLPLSYEAQCDRRFLTGAPRRHSPHLISDFAPLFTKSTQPMSEEDKRRLGFLTPPSNSPKEQTLRVLEERHRYDRPCSPNAKSLQNEPTKMPNLHKKVATDFVPECAAKRTEAAEVRYSACAARMHEIQAADHTMGRRDWR